MNKEPETLDLVEDILPFCKSKPADEKVDIDDGNC